MEVLLGLLVLGVVPLVVVWAGARYAAFLERLERPAQHPVVKRTANPETLRSGGRRLVMARLVGLAVVEGDLLIELSDESDVPRWLNGRVPADLADVLEDMIDRGEPVQMWLEDEGDAHLDIGGARVRLRSLSTQHDPPGSS